MRDSIDSKGRYASRIKFVHDVLAMGDDCGQTNMQLVGNLLVDIPLNNQYQNFYLPIGKYSGITGRNIHRQVASARMGMLLQHKQRLDQNIL